VICPYCGCGCSIILDVKNGQIIRSRGNPDGPANHGWLCVKGHFGLDFVRHPDRLTKCGIRNAQKCYPVRWTPKSHTDSFGEQSEGSRLNKDSSSPSGTQNDNLHSDLPTYPADAIDNSIDTNQQRLNKPLIRKNGVLCESTWEEAIDLIVKKFADIKKQSGSEALAVLSSAKCSNEENYLMQKFCRVLFGNNNIDHCARLCHASTVTGLVRAFGSAAMSNSIDEIENTKLIFVIGSNTTEAHPVIGYAVKRAVLKGAKLVVADPRAIELTEFAEIWLQHRCGTDVALINGLMNVIISEGLEHKDFIKTRTEGFEAVKKIVANYPPEKAAEITGVPAEDIRRAARFYATSPDVMTIYSMGITQHTTGTDNTMSLANLVMLCGQIGKLYSGLNPLRGQVNVQGACDVGCLPDVYPGYQAVNNPEIKKKFEALWKVPLSDKPGLTVTEIINAAGQGKIKGLYIMGENPMLSDPDITHVNEGLKKIDFLVVQDMFLTETAQRANVVLPACSFAEKDGSYTNTERRVQWSNKAIEPQGQSRPDWQILSEIGGRLGKELGIGCKFDYQSVGELTDEIASLTPIYGGITYERLKPIHNLSLITYNSLQWPCPDETHPGTKFLHGGKFTCGLGKFHPIEYKPPAEEPDQDYPFIMTTGRILYHYHTGSMTRRSTGPVFKVPEASVEINPSDAKSIGVGDGEKVQVTSRRGSITIKAEVTDRVPNGTVFIPFHFAEAAANMLTNPALDPVAKIPEFKFCAVRITKELNFS
ncbi:MAG: formate dehydrogenase subunit alpha, partial [Planctomycetota bacterium]